MNSLKREALLEHLLLQGAIEVSGFDTKTGETVYSITEKLSEIAPEMYKDLEKTYVKSMLQMIYKGPTIMDWKL